MKKHEEDKSFHIKVVPGRPLMWKRPPTKRNFTFHLPKFGKTKQNSLNKENLSTFKKNNSKLKIIGSNENKTKDDSLSCVRDVSQKNILKDKTNTTNVGDPAVKHILVPVKSTENNHKIPISASKPCEKYETPFLPLLPLTSLQRRLVDAYGSFSQRKSAETSQSTLSTNSSSKLTVPSLLIPDKSSTSINILSNDTTKCDDSKESNSLQKTATKNSSISEYLNSMYVSSDTGNSKKRKSINDSVDCMESLKNNQRTLFSFSDTKAKQISPMCKKINRKCSKTASPNQSLLKNGNRSNFDGSEISCEINDKSEILIVPMAEEKILNTPLHNNLSQAKRRKVALQKSNIEPNVLEETGFPTSIESINTNILVISPLGIRHKSNSSNYSKSNDGHIKENLHAVNKREEKDLDKNIISFVTLGTQQKLNFFKDNEKVNQATHVQEMELTKSIGLNNKENKFCSPQELITKMRNRIVKKRNLKYQILPNESSNISKIIKNSQKIRQKLKKPFRKSPAVSNVTELPEKIRALLWKKTSLKRNRSNLTDLEVVLHIFAENAYHMKDQTSNVNIYQILKSYEHAVIKDLTNLISQTVELQDKHKRINKLYRQLNRKGKELGVLIDERHKLCHKIKSGEVHLKNNSV